jgi:predicted nucleotidyltransferase
MKTIKELFFSQSMRRWHFEDLVRESKQSRERVNHYVKQLLKEKLILRTKPKAKMPYYEANRESQKFRMEKRLFGLELLEKAGLFEELGNQDEVKSAIVFGSFSRGDWNESSDVDLFVFGDISQFDKAKIESKLKKEVQLFCYNDIKNIKRELDPNLIPKIAQGFSVKGTLEPFEVRLNEH